MNKRNKHRRPDAAIITIIMVIILGRGIAGGSAARTSPASRSTRGAIGVWTLWTVKLIADTRARAVEINKRWPPTPSSGRRLSRCNDGTKLTPERPCEGVGDCITSSSSLNNIIYSYIIIFYVAVLRFYFTRLHLVMNNIIIRSARQQVVPAQECSSLFCSYVCFFFFFFSATHYLIGISHLYTTMRFSRRCLMSQHAQPEKVIAMNNYNL